MKLDKFSDKENKIAAKQGSTPQEISKFYVIPNDKEEKITILPGSGGEDLILTKKEAQLLANIINQCIHEW